MYGVLPRQISGLKGILFIPFLHADWEHLFSNVIPLLVTGSMLFYFTGNGCEGILLIYILSGFLAVAWRTRKLSYWCQQYCLWHLRHFILSGFIRKYTGLIAVSLLMVFLYGSLVWGLFPVVPKFRGKGIYLVPCPEYFCAIVFRKEGQQQEVYEWTDDDEPFDDHENDDNAPQSSLKIVYSYKNQTEKWH